MRLDSSSDLQEVVYKELVNVGFLDSSFLYRIEIAASVVQVKFSASRVLAWSSKV